MLHACVHLPSNFEPFKHENQTQTADDHVGLDCLATLLKNAISGLSCDAMCRTLHTRGVAYVMGIAIGICMYIVGCTLCSLWTMAEVVTAVKRRVNYSSCRNCDSL